MERGKAALPTPMPGCGSSPCPKCGTASPCVDHIAVDIGVGIQTGEHEYCCPEHGGFAFPASGGVVFRDDQPELTEEERAEQAAFMAEVSRG